MSMPVSWAMRRVVVPWKPYSPKTLRATLRILAFMESGSFRAFSSGEIILVSNFCFHHLMEKYRFISFVSRKIL